MTETHIAYWELSPTIDHVTSISRGGADETGNYITTSMLNNSIKSSWSLEQLGWKLYPCGNYNEWDGLTSYFIEVVKNDKELLKDNYINAYYKASLEGFMVF